MNQIAILNTVFRHFRTIRGSPTGQSENILRRHIIFGNSPSQSTRCQIRPPFLRPSIPTNKEHLFPLPFFVVLDIDHFEFLAIFQIISRKFRAVDMNKIIHVQAFDILGNQPG